MTDHNDDAEVLRLMREILALDHVDSLSLETPSKAEGWPPVPRPTWICFYTVNYPDGDRDTNYTHGATALEVVRAAYTAMKDW